MFITDLYIVDFIVEDALPSVDVIFSCNLDLSMLQSRDSLITGDYLSIFTCSLWCVISTQPTCRSYTSHMQYWELYDHPEITPTVELGQYFRSLLLKKFIFMIVGGWADY